ncbi:protein adenylyltransferase SelO, mitochondrial-like [Halichondria panicea]|uniref:protein adenylyltransferase SelO, mitochondrial-like n=1 Tax=Halichondria panicea TaxID=6063 RepID=UPI00312B3BE7
MALSAGKSLETLEFVNSAVKSLPLDSEEENYVRTVQGACFSRVRPTPLTNPSLVVHSDDAFSLLDLPSSEIQREEFIEYFSGNKILPGSEPAAHCYCGHQFGNFAGQLGDGCAILLGEVRTDRGDRWEVQLKGSGKTPFSRQADGRKVLRSSIREFLCSEAMHHLGVPSTRAGSCITSDDRVIRDILYNGNPIQERATVISRISPTFLRFGSFEILKTRDPQTGRTGPSVGRTEVLEQLIDYTTDNFFKEVHSAHPDDRGKRVAGFFEEVCRRTARLVALWQSVGFCHGVLNTDNMSIIGVTIDYGPFGFLDRYDPGHICNGSDDGGRYSFSRQPAICRWNLNKLAEALHDYLDDQEVEKSLEIFDEEFEKNYLSKMRRKLGLLHHELPNDSDLIESLFDVMHKTGCDFTNGFQALSLISPQGNPGESDSTVETILDQCSSPEEIVRGYRPSMHPRQLQMFQALMQSSPDILATLGVSSESITAELQRLETIQKLKTMSVEEKRERDKETWTLWIKTYSERLSQEIEGLDASEVCRNRVKVMAQNNPKCILRNHIAQKAIELAEEGDYSEVRKVLQILKKPYCTPQDRGTAETVEPMTVTDLSCANNVKEGDVYFSKPPIVALGTVVT